MVEFKTSNIPNHLLWRPGLGIYIENGCQNFISVEVVAFFGVHKDKKKTHTKKVIMQISKVIRPGTLFKNFGCQK